MLEGSPGCKCCIWCFCHEQEQWKYPRGRSSLYRFATQRTYCTFWQQTIGYCMNKSVHTIGTYVNMELHVCIACVLSITDVAPTPPPNPPPPLPPPTGDMSTSRGKHIYKNTHLWIYWCQSIDYCLVWIIIDSLYVSIDTVLQYVDNTPGPPPPHPQGILPHTHMGRE